MKVEIELQVNKKFKKKKIYFCELNFDSFKTYSFEKHPQRMIIVVK